jgi:phage gp16-like protein
VNFKKRNGTQLRNAELAQIHIARTQLGLDDDTYRAIIFTISHGRTRSSSDLDWTGRKQLLEHFKAKGWKPSAPRKAKAAKPVSKGQAGLVRRLWDELHQQDKVNDASDAALCAWLKRNKLPERLEWLNGEQLNRVIESLKKWNDR